MKKMSEVSNGLEGLKKGGGGWGLRFRARKGKQLKWRVYLKVISMRVFLNPSELGKVTPHY